MSGSGVWLAHDPRAVNSRQQCGSRADYSFIRRMRAVVQVDLTLRHFTGPLSQHVLTELFVNVVKWKRHCLVTQTTMSFTKSLTWHLNTVGDVLTKLNFQYGRRGCCCWADCCHVPAVPVVVLWGLCSGSYKNPEQAYLLLIICSG